MIHYMWRIFYNICIPPSEKRRNSNVAKMNSMLNDDISPQYFSFKKNQFSVVFFQWSNPEKKNKANQKHHFSLHCTFIFTFLLIHFLRIGSLVSDLHVLCSCVFLYSNICIVISFFHLPCWPIISSSFFIYDIILYTWQFQPLNITLQWLIMLKLQCSIYILLQLFTFVQFLSFTFQSISLPKTCRDHRWQRILFLLPYSVIESFIFLSWS